MSILIISLALALTYLTILILLSVGWNKIPVYQPDKNDFKVQFSVVIPFRNEIAHLHKLLESLDRLDYPPDNFEVIFVDDFSDDGGSELIRKYITEHKKNNFRLLQLDNENSYGKKAAISKAVEESKSEWIVCTDADCTFSKNWLMLLSSFILEYSPVMVSMPVEYHTGHLFFGNFQYLEFSSLIGIGAAMTGLKKPYLCNGANLAFTRNSFIEVSGYTGNEDIASGDDIFLMKKVHKQYPGKVKFLKNHEAIVFTNPKASFHEFVQQRKRWVSKTSAESFSSILFPAFIWIFHLFALVTLCFSLSSKYALLSFILLIIAKFAGESFLIVPLLKFFKQIKLYRWYFISALLYLLYVSLIPLISVFSKTKWKNRKI